MKYNFFTTHFGCCAKLVRNLVKYCYFHRESQSGNVIFGLKPIEPIGGGDTAHCLPNQCRASQHFIKQDPDQNNFII